MTATTLVSLALSLALAQHQGHADPVAEQPLPAADHAAAAQPAEHGAAGHQAMAAEPGAPGGHGEAGGHEGHPQDLGSVMMHHVADGYVIEFPGRCQGGFAWNCEWNLKETFGDALKFGPVDMTPTKHLVMMWIASAILLVVALGAVRKKALVPRGLYNFVELLVQFVRKDIAIANIGAHDAHRFVPYLVSVFFFILFLNLFGLVPFAATATANISVTVALALFTFVITQYAAIKAMGLGGWLKHLTAGVHWGLWLIMVPVEFLGLFTKPFALTVRLFANMVAGHFVILALLGLIFAISVGLFPVSMALALAIFVLELFVALVQAYIFTMLSALFIGAGLAHHGHEAHGHDDHHGPAAAEAHH
jgi:F-type H+-transporting ATPase subunit a